LSLVIRPESSLKPTLKSSQVQGTINKGRKTGDKDAPMPDYTITDLSKMIDHSLLNPVMTDTELEAGCKVAKLYDCASVCIKPDWVGRAAEWLEGSTVKVGTVIGFPHGSNKTTIKAAEARAAMTDGAVELDMVVNIGKVLSGDWGSVRSDIQTLHDACKSGRSILKVIFENCFLKDEHKRTLCKICGEIGVEFVKTSTGYGSGGATDEDLKLMRECSPAKVQVKAAGGVRTLDRLLAVRAMGVTRVGATATAVILDEARKRMGLPPLASAPATAGAAGY
jgi:deoxyribose-phosphate aldolase